MASRRLELAVVLIAMADAVMPFAVAAVDIVIGGKDGWKPDFNYTNWANSMEFRVGDKIGIRSTFAIILYAFSIGHQNKQINKVID